MLARWPQRSSLHGGPAPPLAALHFILAARILHGGIDASRSSSSSPVPT